MSYWPIVNGERIRPYFEVLIHIPCGTENKLHPGTADLIARCSDYYANHFCVKCGCYCKVDSFKWPNGDIYRKG